MWATVRIYQPIHTEVAIVDSLPMVSAVIVHGLAVFGLSLINSMIAPLPYETAAHEIVILNPCKIVFQITWSIAHGMTVLYHKKGFIRAAVNISFDFVKRRIHAAVDINIGKIILPLISPVKSAFIVSQTAGIKLFCP